MYEKELINIIKSPNFIFIGLYETGLRDLKIFNLLLKKAGCKGTIKNKRELKEAYKTIYVNIYNKLLDEIIEDIQQKEGKEQKEASDKLREIIEELDLKTAEEI